MLFTKEELEAMALADAEIDAEPDELSWFELKQSEKLDRVASVEALDPEQRLKKEKSKDYQRRTRKKQQEFRDKNRESLNQWYREYYATHKEQEAARKKGWYIQNRERILQHQREYRMKKRME